MEKLLQYWDDIDDLLGMIGLLAERVRRLLLFALGVALFIALVSLFAVVAFTKPPLALAIATLLAVLLLYRSVTGPRPRAATT